MGDRSRFRSAVLWKNMGFLNITKLMHCGVYAWCIMDRLCM